jgi:hypothetical protein
MLLLFNSNKDAHQMTDTLSIGDMFEELMRDYDEGYHDDDSYNPEGYEDYLNSLTDDEFELLYLERFSAC